jgi:transcriptional regulator with XRE-family HTH domain
VTGLRIWREGLGITQGEAAERLGLSRSVYAPIESGRLRPTRAVAERMRRHLGRKYEALLKPLQVSVIRDRSR